MSVESRSPPLINTSTVRSSCSPAQLLILNEPLKVSWKVDNGVIHALPWGHRAAKLAPRRLLYWRVLAVCWLPERTSFEEIRRAESGRCKEMRLIFYSVWGATRTCRHLRQKKKRGGKKVFFLSGTLQANTNIAAAQARTHTCEHTRTHRHVPKDTHKPTNVTQHLPHIPGSPELALSTSAIHSFLILHQFPNSSSSTPHLIPKPLV